MTKAGVPFDADLLERSVGAAIFARNVPAYRRSFDDAGVTEISAGEWMGLPMISKELLISAGSEHPPYGDRLGVRTEDIAWVFVAPGPIYMPFTSADIDIHAGRFADTFARCGLKSTDVVDQTTLYNWVVAATLVGKGIERLGATVVPGGPGDTQRHLEVIEGLGITAILAFPTFLIHLLDTAAEQGRTLPLERAIVMGELHDPRDKERIRSNYGIGVREYYGTADVGPVAFECGVGSGMHLREDILVEFVDPSTGSLAFEVSPSHPAEIVVTDPDRRGMPIIRLRTGDLVDTFVRDECGCGLASPRIGRIIGRVGDIAKVKGMFVVPGAAKTVLLRHGIVAPHQLVVSRDRGRDRLTLRIEGPRPSGWDEVIEDVSQILRVRCDSEFVDALDDGRVLVDNRMI